MDLKDAAAGGLGITALLGTIFVYLAWNGVLIYGLCCLGKWVLSCF